MASHKTHAKLKEKSENSSKRLTGVGIRCSKSFPSSSSSELASSRRKSPEHEVGENRNSKEQETMRKLTWREVRAWKTKEHARTFLPRRRPPKMSPEVKGATKMKRHGGGFGRRV